MSGRAPRLMAISDRKSLGGADLVDWCRQLSRAGVDAIQLREKDLGDRELFELAARIRAAISTETALLVNSRLDIAVAAGADGVHLPATGLPATLLRRAFGAGPLIGRSTHEPGEVAEALQETVDYVTFGPVFPTPSKAAFGPPPGLPGLERAARSGLPVLALGGVTIERLADLARAGARGVAGIRMFHDRERLERLVADARTLFGPGRS